MNNHSFTNLNSLLHAPLDRILLKGQTVTVLRDLIISGQISAGTKITERDVAQMLGISRMPAREALMELEGQGLIISKPGRRFVIELKRDDILNLYQIRTALERLAVEAAVRNITPRSSATIEAKYQELKHAAESNDLNGFARADLEIHEAIWQISANPQLIRMLHSIIGPTFMLISNQTGMVENYLDTLELHANLVEAICAKDIEKAMQALAVHMDDSLNLSMRLLK